jgi:hypothetical protein
MASVELRTPAGWTVNRTDPIRIPPLSEGKIQLPAVAPLHPAQRREVLGLAVTFGPWKLGEAAEAIVDYLE